MHEFVSFNNQILPACDTKIKVISSAVLYGRGVFTTLAIYESKPFLWEKHWFRLNQHAHQIGIDLSGFSDKETLRNLTQIIAKNNISNARCRLTFFDQSTSIIWQSPSEQKTSEQKTSLLMQTADLREIKQYYRITQSPFSVNSKSPLAGIKSCNYLENILAFENATAGGFDEAVRLNENGDITSTCMANIFWIENEKIYTPSLKTGCLAGTIRELLLENFEIIQTEAKPEILDKATAIFLTSAGIGLSRAGFGDKERQISRTFRRLKEFLDLNQLKS